MKVLVTGANGFVGAALCGALVDAGHMVRGTVRAGGTTAPAAELVATGELGPNTAWGPAVGGMDAIVHLAARAHVLREDPRRARGEHRRVNVEATRGLAEAAAKAGVGAMVFVSSIGAVATRSEVPLSESAPCRPTTPYGMSKLEAERVLREVASDTGLRVVIVRPPMVYGPGAPGNFGLLRRAVERGWPLPLALVRNRRSFVYLGNLVHALIRCLEPAATGATFHVADREVVSTPELIRRLAAARGRRARLFPVPPGVLRLAGAVLGRGDAVARLLDSLVVDAGLIARVLDWSPPYTLDDGLARTVAKT